LERPSLNAAGLHADAGDMPGVSSPSPGADERPGDPLVDMTRDLLELRAVDTTDRREGERRDESPGRRPGDLAPVRLRYIHAAIGVIAGFGAMVCAGFALFRPPVTRRASELCGDGLGGQVVIHRGLSWLWIPAMIGMVLAVVVPHRKQRPVLTLFCAGLVLGMGAGAMLRVETVVAGLCLA
jgi:hypothetical protein